MKLSQTFLYLFQLPEVEQFVPRQRETPQEAVSQADLPGVRRQRGFPQAPEEEEGGAAGDARPAEAVQVQTRLR